MVSESRIDTLMLLMRMRMKKLPQNKVAKELGMTRNTFQKKINNKSEFTISEVAKLANMLDVPIDSSIFFREEHY